MARNKNESPLGGRAVRILIVDDHPLVRHGLAQLIAGEPDLEVCGEAADAGDALRKVKTSRPHLVIVDISLKTGHGVELIKQIRAHDEQIKLLVLSMHDESVYAERVLHAGALGYVNKREAPQTMIRAIRDVLAGKVHLSSQVSDSMLHRMVDRGETLERSAMDCLTDRELEVFELIGDGKTTREIAAALHLGIKTVETHREHIKTKLNLRNAAELTRRAVQWVMEKG